MKVKCYKHNVVILGGTCSQCDEEAGQSKRERYPGVVIPEDVYGEGPLPQRYDGEPIKREVITPLVPTVLVCGSRDYVDAVYIERELARLPRQTIIVHGCASGADTIAQALWTMTFGGTAKGIPADWARYKHAAGAIRNQQLLDTFHPQACLAFHNKQKLRESKGTYDMVQRCLGAKIPVRVYGRDTKIRDLARWAKEPLVPPPPPPTQ